VLLLPRLGLTSEEDARDGVGQLDGHRVVVGLLPARIASAERGFAAGLSKTLHPIRK
jgi:hypothetical protein